MAQVEQTKTENNEQTLDQQIETIRARLWQGGYDSRHDEMLLNQAHEEAVKLKNTRMQIRVMRLLGTFAYLVMNLEQAQTYLNKALALALRLQDTAEMLNLGANLGILYRGRGDPQEAVRHFAPFIEKLDLVEVTPELARSAVTVLLRYVICLVLVHDYEQAQMRLEEASEILKQYDRTDITPEEALGFRSYSAYARAVIYMSRGEYDRAQQQCQEYDDVTRRLGSFPERLQGRLLVLRLGVLTAPDEEIRERRWLNALTTFQPYLIHPKHHVILHHLGLFGFLESADYFREHGLYGCARRCAEQALEIFRIVERDEMIARAQAFLDKLEEPDN